MQGLIQVSAVLQQEAEVQVDAGSQLGGQDARSLNSVLRGLDRFRQIAGQSQHLGEGEEDLSALRVFLAKLDQRVQAPAFRQELCAAGGNWDFGRAGRGAGGE